MVVGVAVALGAAFDSSAGAKIEVSYPNWANSKGSKSGETAFQDEVSSSADQFLKSCQTSTRDNGTGVGGASGSVAGGRGRCRGVGA